MAERCVIIGAGIIGLACAYQLRLRGTEVTLIDPDLEDDSASVGNAGGIAVTEILPAAPPRSLWQAAQWVFDPLGPVAIRPSHAPHLVPWLVRFLIASRPKRSHAISSALARLLAPTYGDLIPMLKNIGLSSELAQTGALSLYETERGFEADAADWARKRELGVPVSGLTAGEAREMEPALGPLVRRAIWTPSWSQIRDPRRLTDGLRRWLVASGAAFCPGKAEHIAEAPTGTVEIRLRGGRCLKAGKVVVAAGAWSGTLAKRIGDRVVMESERGYTLTVPSPGLELGRELIFAERKFVAAPLSVGLRIGGAAEFGGLAARPNFKRSHALATLAKLYLPTLRTEGGTCWAGHRPTTPDSLPVIGASPRRPNIFYAFGHSHLGLTLAATTGRLIAELVHGERPNLDLEPFSIARFARGGPAGLQ